MIIIFGGLVDSVEAYVCERLLSKNIDFLLLDARQYPHQFDLDYYLKDGVIEGFIRYGSQKLALSDIRSIYVRYITKPSWPLLALADTLPSLVVNRPSASASNASKPYQQQIISKYGFKVPCTLVTTVPEEARCFYEEYDGRVIYKSVSSVRSIVKKLTPADLKQMEQVRNCPVQFQEYVPGVDIRVHTVGNRLFAAEITSEASDYRYASEDDNRIIRGIELPADIAQRCLDLTKGLGLVMGGIDLRRSPSGDYYCFEVNPSPAFTFFESYTQHKIGDALTKLLHQGESLKEKMSFILDGSQSIDKRPFISDELRPKVGSDLEQYPPLAPDVSKDEIHRRIQEMIGKKQREKLGIADSQISPEVWKEFFKKSPQAEWTILEQEAVLLNLETGVYFTLNRVGKGIWELFTGEQSLESILLVICKQFEVAEDVARADLIALVTKLSQEGLIKNVNK
ncbi:PqqD family peptide modification chaperone [Nostoc sp. UCD121]|uniref:PqqD family peptide modification chaperone n=1 Tax=unclassified Nostoc TaxID=2593658 RepID=UPI00162ABDC8|nr:MULTISPECIES: PqqD family peptide modification chaperone [unclassified Nostoc]MBC1224362.1 PqqD family peptide modification chaperone [Nostoc sp. UCD120]MBC1279558.1 PqqD family peptide modification chaperone [Nostoc sp. UCD121]MBC1296457.1 PqqD family peptide modification chaperone [Nostoc sp. UCD122]